jgi:hypothetical protein
MSDIYQFVTITFNHADLIEEHLESIKLQILNFGVNKIVQLTIIDDCSDDKNVEVISDWLERNEEIFWEKKLIVNEVNLGIKSNFMKATNEIVTPKYKLLGGDDMYNKTTNVFSFMDYCSNYQCVFSPMLILGRMTTGQRLYIYRLSFFLKNKHLLQLVLKDMNIFSAPGSYVSPAILNSDEYLNYLNLAAEDYEDWPTWRYLFIEANKSLNFYDKFVVDYRPSSSRKLDIHSDNKKKVVLVLRTKSFVNKILTHLKLRFMYKNGWVFIILDFYSIRKFVFNKMTTLLFEHKD